VSHKLDQSKDWSHEHHVGKFDPKKVRLHDNSTKLLTDDECDFLIALTQKKHDYNGCARQTTPTIVNDSTVVAPGMPV